MGMPPAEERPGTGDEPEPVLPLPEEGAEVVYDEMHTV